MKCYETGKQIYLTPHTANEALAAMRKKKTRSVTARAGSWSGGQAEVYKCNFCNAYHIGHTIPVGKKPAG